MIVIINNIITEYYFYLFDLFFLQVTALFFILLECIFSLISKLVLGVVDLQFVHKKLI